MPDPCSVVSLLVASVIILCAHKTLQPPSDPHTRGLQTTPRPLSELTNPGAQIITEPAFETVTIGKENGALITKFRQTEDNPAVPAVDFLCGHVSQ